MNTLLIGHPKTDPRDDETNCRSAILAAEWWRRADLAEHYPLTTDEAVHLLDAAGEYDIDRARLMELVRRKIVAMPAVEDGELEWSASDLLAVAGILETRGQYRPTPSMQDCKKSQAQILMEQARQDGDLHLIAKPAGHPCLDVAHLLALLRHADNRNMREQLVAHLRATLEVEHGITV